LTTTFFVLYHKILKWFLVAHLAKLRFSYSVIFKRINIPSRNTLKLAFTRFLLHFKKSLKDKNHKILLQSEYCTVRRTRRYLILLDVKHVFDKYYKVHSYFYYLCLFFFLNNRKVTYCILCQKILNIWVEGIWVDFELQRTS
jgi:hypothetical protein